MTASSRLARFAHLPVLTPDLAKLPPDQTDLWRRLGDIPEAFVLYGGTALALRLGHRESEDFDFFCDEPFRPGELLDSLRWLGRVEVSTAAGNTLEIIESGGVRLSFFGALDLAVVAEPAVVAENGIVVASLFDLAGTKAKAIVDRSEWKDYVDIAALLRDGVRLADVIGYATTIFDRRFAFPAPEFLRSLVWFADGTAPDVPGDARQVLERAVHDLDFADIPRVEPYRTSIRPW
jgi:hypothetical protein